jgi:mRNA degradation ribonuclease J1/J2
MPGFIGAGHCDARVRICPEAEQLIEDARRLALSTMESCLASNNREYGAVKAKIRDEVSRLMYERTNEAR